VSEAVVEKKRDFHGVAITVNDDGSESVEYCGGYVPRALTADELSPWLALIDSRWQRTPAADDSPCLAA